MGKIPDGVGGFWDCVCEEACFRVTTQGHPYKGFRLVCANGLVFPDSPVACDLTPCPYKCIGFVSAKIDAESMELSCRWRQKLQATSLAPPVYEPLAHTSPTMHRLTVPSGRRLPHRRVPPPGARANATALPKGRAWRIFNEMTFTDPSARPRRFPFRDT